MNRQNIWMLFFVTGFLLVTTQQGLAQQASTSAQNKSNQDRIIQEILNEVRQLRAEVQRLRANAFQTQVIVEQLRLQQDQVTRLTREISEIREKISDTKVRQVKMTGISEETEKKVNVGLIPQSELMKINSEIEELKDKEQRLTEQESQMSTELESGRIKLVALNKRLEELGQATVGSDDEKRTNKNDKK